MTRRSSRSNNMHVTRAPGGGWRAKRAGATRASVVKRTQAQAEQAAKRIVGRSGGGEVRIHDRKGQIRDSDTVKPGNDPRSIRDTRH